MPQTKLQFDFSNFPTPGEAFDNLVTKVKNSLEHVKNIGLGLAETPGDVALKLGGATVGGAIEQLGAETERFIESEGRTAPDLSLKSFAKENLDPLVESEAFVSELIPEAQPESLIEGFLGKDAAGVIKANPTLTNRVLTTTDKFVTENFKPLAAAIRTANAAFGAPTAGVLDLVRQEGRKGGIDPDRPGAVFSDPGNTAKVGGLSILALSGLSGFWNTVRDPELIDPDTGEKATTQARTRLAMPHLMQSLVTVLTAGRLIRTGARGLTKSRTDLEPVQSPFVGIDPGEGVRTRTDIRRDLAEKLGETDVDPAEIINSAKNRTKNITESINRDKLFAPEGGETGVIQPSRRSGILDASGKPINILDETAETLTSEALTKHIKTLFDEEDLLVAKKVSEKLGKEIGDEPPLMRVLTEMIEIENDRFVEKIRRTQKLTGLTDEGAVIAEVAKTFNTLEDIQGEISRVKQNILTTGNLAGRNNQAISAYSKLSKELRAAHPEFLSNVEKLSEQLETQNTLNNLMGMSLSFVTSLPTTISRNIRGQFARTLLDGVENTIAEGIIRKSPLDNVSKDALLQRASQLDRSTFRDRLTSDLAFVPDTFVGFAGKTLDRLEAGGGRTAALASSMRNQLHKKFPKQAKALDEANTYVKIFEEVPKIQAQLFGGLTAEGVLIQQTKFPTFRERFKTGLQVAGEALSEAGTDRPVLFKGAGFKGLRRKDTPRPALSKATGAILSSLSDQASVFNVADDMIQGVAAASMILRRHAMRHMDDVSASAILDELKKAPEARPPWLTEAFNDISNRAPKLTYRATPTGEGILSKYTKNTLEFLGRNPSTMLVGVPPFLRFGYNKFQFLMERNPAILVDYLSPRGRSKLHGAIDKSRLNLEMQRRGIKRIDKEGNLTPEAQGVYDNAARLMQQEAADEIARGLTGSAMLTAAMVARRSPIAGPQFDLLDLRGVGVDFSDEQGNNQFLNISADDPWTTMLFFGEILNTVQDGGSAEDIGRKFTPSQITQNLLNFRNIKNTPFILTDLLRSFDGRGNVADEAFKIASRFMETPLGFITVPFRAVKDASVIASPLADSAGYPEFAQALRDEGSYRQTDEFLGYDSAVSNLPTPLQQAPNLVAEILGVIEPGRKIPKEINPLQGQVPGVNNAPEAIARQFGLSFEGLSPLSQKVESLGLRTTDILGQTSGVAERNSRKVALATLMATPITRGDGQVGYVKDAVEDMLMQLPEELPESVQAEIVKQTFTALRQTPIAGGMSIQDMALRNAALFRDPGAIWDKIRRSVDEISLGFLDERQDEIDEAVRLELRKLRQSEDR